MPRMRDQLLDDRLVVHLAASAPDWTAPDCEVLARGRTGIRPCAPTGRRRGCCGASSASTACGASRCDGAGGQRDEAVPDRLRRLDRDLLADDRARQRREGVAAALEAAVAEARDQLLHHPVALDEVLAGVVPERRRRRLGAVGAVATLSPSPRSCPAAESLSTMPCAASSSRIASARAKSRARLAARARRDRARRCPPRREPAPACRNARGACCRTPSVAPGPCSSARVRGARAAVDLARRARTAPRRRSAC